MNPVPAVLFAVVVPALLIFAVPVFLVGGRFDFLGSMTGSWIRMAGLLPFAASLLLVGWGVHDLFRTTGGGVPKAHPGGLYLRIRNPIWLGVLVSVASQYLLYDWPPIIVYLVVLFVTMDCLLRFGLEPKRLDRFGEDYRTYMETVPRWIPARKRAGTH